MPGLGTAVSRAQIPAPECAWSCSTDSFLTAIPSRATELPTALLRGFYSLWINYFPINYVLIWLGRLLKDVAR